MGVKIASVEMRARRRVVLGAGPSSGLPDEAVDLLAKRLQRTLLELVGRTGSVGVGVRRTDPVCHRDPGVAVQLRSQLVGVTVVHQLPEPATVFEHLADDASAALKFELESDAGDGAADFACAIHSSLQAAGVLLDFRDSHAHSDLILVGGTFCTVGTSARL